MSRFLRASVLVLAPLLLAPSVARAQARDAFVEATVQLIQAAEGEFGDEGRYVRAAVDAMARALSDWDAAVGRAEAGLAADAATAPPGVAARMRASLAAVYLERGRFERALEQIDQSTRLEPALGEAYLLKGLALERLGRNEAAGAAFHAAWQRRPQSLAGAYQVAVAPASSDGDRRAAANELLSALMDAGSGRRLVFPLDAFLDDAASGVPVLPLARYASAFSLVRQGKYDAAVAAFRDAAGSDPLELASARSPELIAAARALRAGDPAGAIEQLTAMVTSRPLVSEAHRVLGLAYAAAGDGERAVEQLVESVRTDTTNERAHLALAAALSKAGRASDARAALRAAIAALPLSGQAQWHLGQLAVQGGDWPEAVGAMERAGSLGPLAGAGALHTALARVCAQLPDLDGAVRAHTARVRAALDDSAAHVDLGGAYRAAGRTREALVEYLAAALLDPGGTDAFAGAGQLLAIEARNAEAAVLLQRAVALDPKHREARYALSRVLTRLDRPDEAAEQLRVYAELQAAAMTEERRRFENNAETIEQLLKRPRDATGGK